ncbi:MAG: hypothetical protein MR992_06120 [Lachnospiraceae bacterium]|nr:hypothetical protein [Lachnospiraceae bacterium]MDD7627647.1 hypothetical protein [Lachnospiraceae bacterium]MDY4119473.1 hypothetical protein [Lachnospiraceae bacterium]
MISASDEFKNKMNNGGLFVNYADVILGDGTELELTPADFMLNGCTVNDKTTDGKFGVGFTAGKTANLSLANFDDRFSTYDFYNAILYLYVGTTLDSGNVEKVRKGKYYIINPTTPGDVINLSGSDSMHLFDKPYEAKTAYPATLLTILSDCCLDCGVSIGFGEFNNWNLVVDKRPEDCTYRQVVSWVAQISGYNARISVNDALELVWYETEEKEKIVYHGGSMTSLNETEIIGGDFDNYEADTIIFGGDFFTYTDDDENVIKNVKSLNISTDDVLITGVKIDSDNGEFLFGEEGYVLTVSKNQLASGKEEEIGNYLGNRLVGLTFRPLTVQSISNPLIEPFETATVYDRKGNSYFALINQVVYRVGGYTEISCKAESPIRNKSAYVNDYARAVAEARRNNKKELSYYDKIVQNMNMLAMNSMGFHTTYEDMEDGSRIVYMHDKPTIEESEIIYKQTIDGFFLSQDGGESYTAGFDSDGNAVFNIIAAIGIVCDWIKGGTLSLGGDNNVNGDMVVYDQEGNVVGRFNKDGLWASNGYFEGTIKSKNAMITGGQISISTSAADYDVIDLKYGAEITKIRPAFIRVEKGSQDFIQITPIQLFAGSSTEFVSISKGMITIKSGGKNSVIGNETRFADYVSIGGNLSVKGKIEGATFSSAVEILGTGSLKLNTAADLECWGKATFYNGIYEGTAFSVDTVGNVTANGAIKSTGNYESSLYKLSLKDSLTVSGETKLNGNVKIGDGTYDNVGFFGSSGSSKKTVTTISSTSSATTSSNATKINEVINALKAYNLL